MKLSTDVCTLLVALLTWPADFLRSFFGVEDLDGRAYQAWVTDVPTCAGCREEHDANTPCPLRGVA